MQKYKLDRKMKLLFWLTGHTPQISNAYIKQTRMGMDANPFGLLYRRVTLGKIENRSIPGRQGSIPIRIYHPVQTGNLPVIVFFHGGGWVLGSLKSHDSICRHLAADNHALVVAVDYRLAPEHKYPAAVEDAYAATCWVAEHATDLGADPDKLIVMGDSAGGNLSAVVSLMARGLGFPRIAFQVLIYPAVDMTEHYPSKELFADNPLLSGHMLVYFAQQYLRTPADIKELQVSPLLAEDLSHLPPALILTAEFDPLRDEGKAYADHLRAAGNEVTDICYPGMPHGFISFGWLASQMNPAFAQIKQTLQRFQP